ncbi:MAG: SDR family oxidoreductase [Chloroflexota bacterium]|nr:MAG: SDR family oxidoreductase [Chloroflexota bacterium]
MRILVTGASGLLGLNTALEASQQHEVFGSVNKNVIQSKTFTVIQSDLTEPGALEKLIDESKPDWVINCAALANLDACEANPALAEKLNSELPGKLANYVAKGGARLVHLSTDAVFDGERGNYTEEDKPNPLSLYARTKLSGEQVVLASNPEAIVARVNLFGWSLSGKRSLAEWFVNNLSAGNKIMGFTDVYFCPLLVNHLATLLLRMLELELHGLYHVVSSECANKFDFGVRLARLFGFDESLIEPASVSESGLSAARSPMLTLKADKLIRELGEPTPGLTEGLAGFYSQYRDGYPEFIQGMKV